MPNPVPTEYDECVKLVQYLCIKKLKFTHVHNEMYTKSWSQKNKAKALGVCPGVPDYMIVIPNDRSEDGISYILFIEMKRVKGYVVSDAQKAWQRALNGVTNVQSYICKGFEEAKEVIDKYII